MTRPTASELERRLAELEDETGDVDRDVCVVHLSAGDEPDREEWLTREEYTARYDDDPDTFGYRVSYEGAP